MLNMFSLEFEDETQTFTGLLGNNYIELVNISSVHIQTENVISSIPLALSLPSDNCPSKATGCAGEIAPFLETISDRQCKGLRPLPIYT